MILTELVAQSAFSLLFCIEHLKPICFLELFMFEIAVNLIWVSSGAVRNRMVKNSVGSSSTYYKGVMSPREDYFKNWNIFHTKWIFLLTFDLCIYFYCTINQEMFCSIVAMKKLTAQTNFEITIQSTWGSKFLELIVNSLTVILSCTFIKNQLHFITGCHISAFSVFHNTLTLTKL